MTPARPYTPDELAELWKCSAETIRTLFRQGKLRGFRLGRNIRIPKDAAREYESCQTSISDDSEGDSASTGTIPKQEKEDVISLRHATERKQKQKR